MDGRAIGQTSGRERLAVKVREQSQLQQQGWWARRYLFSRDHKIIGLQYFFLSLMAAVIGSLLSLAMRWQLAWPGSHVALFGEISPERYLSLLTMHGTLMIFFLLTLAPQSALGNYLLPLQLGAREMAFPALNMWSFWITALSFAVMLAAFFVPGGAPTSGWTHYAPLSAIASAGPGQGMGLDLWLVSIAIFCIGSAMGAINFATTTIKSRAPGMSWMRLPLTCWAWFVNSFLILGAFSVLLAAAIMLFFDRHFGSSFFEPAGLVVSGQLSGHHGGVALLSPHLFLFFRPPEVYNVILPSIGIHSHLPSQFFPQPVF